MARGQAEGAGAARFLNTSPDLQPSLWLPCALASVPPPVPHRVLQSL